MEAAVARAPAGTFTDKEDVVATDRVISVDCVRRRRVVACRPDEKQRSFGAFLNDALVAGVYMVPGLHTGEPCVGGRRGGATS